jgi:DNA invertase Pin-like site-specific DNA recombinase
VQDEREASVKLGYARVSTRDQNAQLQLDALRVAGCDEVLEEHASGKDRKRPKLELAMAKLDAGDTLVVWKLDRLGRSVVDLDTIFTELAERGIGVLVTSQGIDTTNGDNPAAKFYRQMLSAVAEFERSLIRERVNGLAAARKQGRIGGRRFKLTEDDLDLLLELWDRGTPVTSLAKKWNVNEVTIYRAYKRALAKREAEQHGER